MLDDREASRPRRLLWLVRFPPYPPTQGGDVVYSRHLIENLARLVPVDVLYMTQDGVQPVPSPGTTWHAVPLAPSSKLLSLAAPLPNIAYRYRQEDYIAKAVELARTADGVVVDYLALFPLVARLKEKLGKACPPIVVINHNHEASLRGQMAQVAPNPVMRQVLHWDARKATRLEEEANRAAAGLTAITTTDLDTLTAMAPQTPGLLLMPGYTGPRMETRRITEATPMRLCILGGRTSYHKGLVLRQVLDAIVRSGLQTRVIVDVVGSDAPGGGAAPGINFLGFVDDLETYLKDVRLGLIPDTVGGGFKVRALTHTFLRVPMLAVSQAMRGMLLREGTDYLAVETIPEMVDAAEEVMKDVARLNAVQESAYDFSVENFSWEKRAADIVAFFAGLPQGARSHVPV